MLVEAQKKVPACCLTCLTGQAGVCGALASWDMPGAQLWSLMINVIFVLGTRLGKPILAV